MARVYELMVVFRPDLEIKDENAAKALLSGLLKDNVSVDEVTIWGKKPLAYEIKKQKEGNYVLSRLSAKDGIQVADLENKVKLSDTVLRYLFTLVK